MIDSNAAPSAPAATSAAPPLFCGGCGYDLRSTTDRCPECGRHFDPNHTVDALIPWEQRRHVGRLGRVRTYLRTVRLITFRPRDAARYLQRPISLTAARRFRRVTAVLICIPFLAAAKWQWRNERLLILTNPWSLGAALAGILVGALTASRLTAALFDLRSLPAPRRQRSAALGQYACAPLAVLAAAALPLILCWWTSALRKGLSLRNGFPNDLADLLFDWAPLIGGAAALLWLWSTLTLLRYVTGCGWRRLVAAAVALPIIWAGCLVTASTLAVFLAAFVVLVAISLM